MVSRAITPHRSHRAGFTLIELLIVIAILGLLSTLVIVSLRNSRQEANIAKAQADVRQIALAVELLLHDTGSWPAHRLTGGDCYQNQSDPGFFTDYSYAGYYGFDCEVFTRPQANRPYLNLLLPWYGLTGLDPRNQDEYPNWRGPYLSISSLNDPWGTGYNLDGDFHLEGDKVVVFSYGPNGVQDYGGDDIYYTICQWDHSSCLTPPDYGCVCR